MHYYCYSPLLTWRDVQHVIARSARPSPGGVPLRRGMWTKNKAGFAVSKVYGFGLMDAGKMVDLAKHWKRVPKQRKCVLKGQGENRFGFYLIYVSPRSLDGSITSCSSRWFSFCLIVGFIYL